jgi:hypothetical protein
MSSFNTTPSSVRQTPPAALQPAAPRETSRCHTGPVVRTGARATALRSLLIRAGFRAIAAAPPAPRLDALPAHVRDRVIELFQIFGGRTPMPPLRPGAWDLR